MDAAKAMTCSTNTNSCSGTESCVTKTGNKVPNSMWLYLTPNAPQKQPIMPKKKLSVVFSGVQLSGVCEDSDDDDDDDDGHR